MGLAERFVASMFEKDSQGREVFFPFGWIGRGRVIEGEENLVRLKRNMKWLLLGVIVLCLSVLALMEGLAKILPMLLILVLSQIIVIGMVRRHPISELNLSWSSGIQKTSYVLGAPILWILFIFMILMVILFTTVFIVDPHIMDLFSIVIFFIFVIGAVFNGWMLWIRSLHISRRHQAHLMAQRRDRARPMMRCRARLHANQTRWLFLEERHDLAAS